MDGARVKLIAILDAFVDSSLTVALPLYLLSLSIGISEIGLILAVMPVIFLLVRLLLAALGDQIGTKNIFISNGIFGAASGIIYAFAFTPAMFSLGKIFEGFRASAFWAVGRTDIFSHGSRDGKQARESASMVSLRILSVSFAKLVTGALIVYLSFHNTFLAIAALGIIITIIALTFPAKVNQQVSPRRLISVITQKRGLEFWLPAIPLAFNAFGAIAIVAFGLPIFMSSSLHMGYELIGLLLAVFFLIEALTNYLVTRFRLPYRYIFFLSIIFCGLPGIVLWVPQLFIPALLLHAVGWGLLDAAYEYVLAHAVRNSKSISTDIALLMVPCRIAEFLAFIAGGFIISYFGYAPLFILGASALALSSIIPMRMIKDGVK